MDEVPVKMPERVTIKRVRIPFAECLRFPGEGKSTQGKSDPNTRPKGVVDGWQVNIPALCSWTNSVTLDRTVYPVLDRGAARPRTLTIPKSSEGQPRKARGRSKRATRTKTDTGWRDEYSQALERTLVKELCKLAP